MCQPPKKVERLRPNAVNFGQEDLIKMNTHSVIISHTHIIAPAGANLPAAAKITNWVMIPDGAYVRYSPTKGVTFIGVYDGRPVVVKKSGGQILGYDAKKYKSFNHWASTHLSRIHSKGRTLNIYSPTSGVEYCVDGVWYPLSTIRSYHY